MKINLFPLDIAVLPLEQVPLHIFESRYKKMIKEYLSEGKPFGIVHRSKNSIESIGCSVEISDIIKSYPSGEYDLIIKGKDKFRINNRIKNDGIWVGDIDYFPIPISNKNEKNDKLSDLYLQVLLQLGINRNIERHLGKKLSYEYLSGIVLPNTIKMELLLIEHENERIDYIYKLFKKILEQANRKVLPKDNIGNA